MNAVITGANRGIGKQTAIALARLGHTVIMACRNVDAAALACSEVKAASGNDDVFVMELDISSSKSIRSFVQAYSERFKELHILVNNAGVSKNSRELTEDGFEMNVGTNFFGTYLLTSLLVPLFPENADCRIVIVTSNIYKIGGFRLDRIDRYRWFKAYAVSKYMLLLYSMWLSGQLKDRGIKVNAVHPGIVRTSIMYTGRWYDAIIKLLLAPFFVSVEDGAKGHVHLATAEGIGTGDYYEKSRVVKIPRRYISDRKTQELMEYSAKYMEKVLSSR
jgi:NAD(P)-dependent dehydrogenase (short-subunit alcohol dehydrogenase family)